MGDSRVHPSNAHAPIVVRLSGNLIDVREVQSLNVHSAIFVVPCGIVNSISLSRSRLFSSKYLFKCSPVKVVFVIALVSTLLTNYNAILVNILQIIDLICFIKLCTFVRCHSS